VVATTAQFMAIPMARFAHYCANAAALATSPLPFLSPTLRRLHGVAQALRRIAVHRLAARSRPCCGPPSPELLSTGLAGLARFALPHGPPGSTIWEVTMVAEVRPIGRSASAAGFVLGRRLDSIPFSPYHAMVIAVLALVGFVEGYDLAITGLVLVMAKAPLHLTEAHIRWLAVGSTFMICVGGFMASAMSDHWSRKTVMQIGVVGTTFFTLLIPVGAKRRAADHRASLDRSRRRICCLGAVPDRRRADAVTAPAHLRRRL